MLQLIRYNVTSRQCLFASECVLPFMNDISNVHKGSFKIFITFHNNAEVESRDNLVNTITTACNCHTIPYSVRNLTIVALLAIAQLNIKVDQSFSHYDFL